MAFLTGIGGKIAGIAVIALIIAGLFGWQRLTAAQLAAAKAQNAVIQSALATQVQVNTDNLVTLAEIRDRSKAEIKAVTAERDAAASRVQVKTVIRERIIHVAAQPNGDAPIAPALAAALDGLRAAAGAGAAGQDPGGKAANPP
jgi:cytoskeletal protein RodZ